MRSSETVGGVNESEGRLLLGAAIAADRGRIYRTVDAARIAAKVARGTWEKAEKGQPVKDFSLAAIEEALGWPAGRAQSIIAGRRLEPARSDSGLRVHVESD